jgi:hypothetical protein
MTQHSIEAKTLPELKQLALEELGLTREAVKQHGDMRSRSTWLKAINQAYKDGLTTQKYKELPVTKAIALPDNVTGSEALSDNTPSEKQIQLSTVPYLEKPEILARLERYFTKKYRAKEFVKPSDLEQLKRTERAFSEYENWMYPGKFVNVQIMGFCQTLFFDEIGHIYFFPFEGKATTGYHLSRFVREATPVNIICKKAVEYLNKLYKTVTGGGIATAAV